MELPGFFRHILNKGKPQQEQRSTQPLSTQESLIRLKAKYRQEELAKKH